MNQFKLTNKGTGEIYEGVHETVDEALAAAGLWLIDKTRIEKKVRDGYREVKPEELVLGKGIDSAIKAVQTEKDEEPAAAEQTGEPSEEQKEIVATIEEPVQEEEPVQSPDIHAVVKHASEEEMKAHEHKLAIEAFAVQAEVMFLEVWLGVGWQSVFP